MTERIIDLRNNVRERPAASTPPQLETIEWTCKEHEAQERGPYWFLGPGAIALALIIFGVFAHSYFFIAFVALAFLVILMYAHRPPREIAFRISRDGVDAGNTHYAFTELKSFWIFENVAPKELSLETTKLLTPYLRIPLGDQKPETIGRLISRFLPEEEHKEFISDQIARSIGF